jgi:ornithine cyclodeaminase
VSGPPWVDVAAVPITTAIAAIEWALVSGLDPAAGEPRSAVGWPPAGQLLLMPARHGRYAGVKLVTVSARSAPRIQGVFALFDAETLAPVALMDGAALTALRTPALSAVAARRLARPDASRLVVFGSGPQGTRHIEALRTVLPISQVGVVGRGDDPSAVRDADVVCCCTTAREPLFDSDLVRDDALVIAVGSHEPDARELDERLLRRATVVVESRGAALSEAGDVIQAGLGVDDLVTIDALVRGDVAIARGPRVFKSVGMPWEDLVVAAAAFEAL